MELLDSIRDHSAIPLSHHFFMGLLKDYKRPNDKLHDWIKNGILTPLKKGVYIAGPALKTKKPESFLIANHLLGPSYVSSDSALSFHGLIPERVYETVSMTTKAARAFKTSVGIFKYIWMPLPYYTYGISQFDLSDNLFAMMATPEKALFDKIASTPGILFRSKISAMDYLIENLRMDEEKLKNLNTSIMTEWLPYCPKKESLSLIIQSIQNL